MEDPYVAHIIPTSFPFMTFPCKVGKADTVELPYKEYVKFVKKISCIETSLYGDYLYLKKKY